MEEIYDLDYDDLDDIQDDDNQEFDNDNVQEDLGYEDPYIEPEYNEDPDTITTAEDLTSVILRERGIEDPDNIKFTDAYGNIQSVKWNDLDGDEQLNILLGERDSEITNDERSFLQMLRDNNMTHQEYVDYIRQDTINRMRQDEEFNPQGIEVKTLSDDEIFILDIQAKNDAISDDEAYEALYMAKQNPELFAKQVNGLRSEYIRREEEKLEEERTREIEEQQRVYNEFSNTVADHVNNLVNSIGGISIEMEPVEKQQLYNFIVEKDETGSSYLGKALNDPELLTKAAWFLLKGDETIQQLTDYYENTIADLQQRLKNNVPNRVVQHTQNPQRHVLNKEVSIYDLD